MKEVSAKDWIRQDSSAQLSAKENSAKPPLRVLLAEDTPISADMLQAMGARLSIAMDTAANGLEAIDMVHDAIADGQPYSLLLLDIMMPILDGVETATRLRDDGITPTELPIVAITAATDLDEIRSYRAAGMQAFLEKPVALADLRSTLLAWGHAHRGPAHQTRPNALDALAKQFEKRKLDTFLAIKMGLEQTTLAEETIVELRRILHQLAGTAGSFGETDLGEEARSLEIELMATFFEGGDVRDVLERAALALELRL